MQQDAGDVAVRLCHRRERTHPCVQPLPLDFVVHPVVHPALHPVVYPASLPDAASPLPMYSRTTRPPTRLLRVVGPMWSTVLPGHLCNTSAKSPLLHSRLLFPARLKHTETPKAVRPQTACKRVTVAGFISWARSSQPSRNRESTTQRRRNAEVNRFWHAILFVKLAVSGLTALPCCAT